MYIIAIIIIFLLGYTQIIIWYMKNPQGTRVRTCGSCGELNSPSVCDGDDVPPEDRTVRRP